MEKWQVGRKNLEYTIRTLEDTAAALAQSIVDTRKRLVDLNEQAGQVFEYGDRLATLIQRQQEVTDALTRWT